MRPFAISLAVAALAVTALPIQASAYCRGCAVSPKAAAANAAAEMIGRSAITDDASRAYASEPMPDTPLPRYSGSDSEGKGAICRVETSTVTMADGSERERRIETCN